MATVEEVLSIPSLRKLKVIGGNKGLNKKVSYVTVMEVPDIVNWLKGNDFLITSFYSVKDDINEQIKLIDDLADASCSCLAVKTGRYVERLDQAIIKKADERGLVLVEIPVEVSYIEIIVNIMDKILERKDIDYIIEKYIKDIVYENYDNQEHIFERGKLLGFNIKGSYTLAITLGGHCSQEKEQSQVLRKIAKNIAKESDSLIGFTYNPVVTISDKSTIFLISNEKDNIENNMKDIVRLTKRQVDIHGLKDIKIGIGSIGIGIDNLRNTYFNSVNILKLSDYINVENDMFYYDKLKIYLYLGKFLNREGEQIFTDLLYELNDKNLLQTLEKYYENNQDINKTGKALYVHGNTVRYRLQKIKEITGYDTSVFEDNFKLYLLILYVKGRKQL